LTSDGTRRKIAEDPGIGLSTPTRWLSQDRDASEASEAPIDLYAELKRLRPKSAVLRQKRDTSRKAAAFFAKAGCGG
jgi:transposase